MTGPHGSAPGEPRLEAADEHDARLLAAVHPPDWRNPKPQGRYNLVVVGAGTAGLVSAAIAAGLGAKVALVERHLMGGDCLNVGCVPSKGVLRAARAVADARSAGRFGVRGLGDVSADFGAAMERMRRLRAGIAAVDGAERFRSLGVDVYLGQGRFAGRDTVAVEGVAGAATLRFQRAVIATGARAALPPVAGLDSISALTNESVFSLTELPERLAVLGGGPIGCELAQAFARFGSRVTLVEQGERVLGRDDPEAAALVQAALARDGVDLQLGCRAASARREGDERVLVLESAGAPRELRTDAVLVGVGRRPNVDGLGLEAAGVAFDEGAGVAVDDRLRTSNRAVYAAGDVCSRYRFTHAADAMARLVVQNALFLGRKRMSALTIPWCTYTDPELAQVGLTARDAEARGSAIDTFVQPLCEVDRAILDGETVGFVKVHVRRGTDRIVGATIVARHAGEMLSEITLAMTARKGLAALGATIHPYPTQADAVRRVADQWSRTRLTPSVKRLMTRWLAFSR
jgi:pyruvate/2-oxoglutarate dehydrogenase complex dihydrolipoamide dehydrogenase (E3) component